MAFLPSIFFFILFSLFVSSSLLSNKTTGGTVSAAVSDGGGEWVLLQQTVGVSAMHMQLLSNNRVIIFDRTNIGPSNLTLPDHKRSCLNYTINTTAVTDCTAHSVSYDVASNDFRPLILHTDTWCSSGSVDPTGTLVQTGGNYYGNRTVRTIPPCGDDMCDWTERQYSLNEGRWYASSQILPDGRVIVVGGLKVFSYEFYPKTTDVSTYYHLNFLVETSDDEFFPNNLYPFLHLLPDGNLFLFANNRSILLNYHNNSVIKEFPVMHGGVQRNYPSTGSSVLLPLKLNGSGLPEAEVLVCGGAELGAVFLVNNKSENEKVYKGASNSCGRIKVTDPNPTWAMEYLPMPRVMSDMLLLPTGDVIIINGASNGTAGWGNAINPVLNPVLYKTYEPKPEARFTILNPSKTPRMYHSSAVLLPDGKILVAGSNPHEMYTFSGEFPTDLSLEAYTPPYLNFTFNYMRPTTLSVKSRTNTVSYGQDFKVRFQLDFHTADHSKFTVAIVTPSFTTHSYAMNQRMVVLEIGRFKPLHSRHRKRNFWGKHDYMIVVRGPLKDTVAPPGYYMLFLVHNGIPSQATWVKLQ